MNKHQLAPLEMLFYSFALGLSTLLLLLQVEPGKAAVPAFLAWMLLNRQKNF
jgi:hypothetical protein